MTLYQLVLIAKFLSVLGYAGGTIAAFLVHDDVARRRAVHQVASPALLATWLSGYALLLLIGWPLFELWVVGGLFLSLLANTALVFCVSRARTGFKAFVLTAAPLIGVVILMVLKPTWSQVAQ